MQRPITYTLLFICLVGLCSAGYKLIWPKPVPQVTVRDPQADTLVSDHRLFAARDYDLLVLGNEDVSQDDSLTWYIQKYELTGLKEVDLQFNEAVREWNFRDTGRYDVRAYLDMVEVAHSVVHVIDGDRFDVNWGDALEKDLGGTFTLRDGSTNVAKRNWTISRADTDEVLASGEEAQLEWMPADTGVYVARIKVDFLSGKVERSKETLVVHAPAPMPEPVPEPELRADPKPAKRWEPPTPSPAPPSNTTGSASCFPMSVRTEGSPFLIKVEKPARDQVHFETEGTTFKISPKYDCMFTGFDYFANGKIDNIEVTIECLNKTCTGRKTYTYKFKGAHDAHDAAKASFTSLPILNKDFEYRITVKALSPGELGFFPLATNLFKPEKQGNTFRQSEASISFSDLKTCIYNLRFVR